MENQLTETLTGGLEPQELRRELQENNRFVASRNRSDDNGFAVSDRSHRTLARPAD